MHSTAQSGFKACALFVLGTLVTAGCAGKPEAPAAGNVVLILVDTLRADRLGCYGYSRDTSPAIDALAAEGVLYESCYSQSCWTLPSMISLMSGLPVTKKERSLPEVTVLAEALKERGLDTAAFVANPTVNEDQGFGRGIDRFLSAKQMESGRAAPQVAQHFASWFERWRAGKRNGGKGEGGFFAWIHFMDPHAPYIPVKEYDLFEGKRLDYKQVIARWRAAEPRVAELSPDLTFLAHRGAQSFMNESSNRYDGEVRTVDASVARIVDVLREAGEFERTLIIICSDHGEMLFEHEDFPYYVQNRVKKKGGLPGGVADLFCNGHLAWFYREVWSTPLILAGPGVPKGVRRKGLAANLDIYPTILEALGMEVPKGLQGESLFKGLEPQRKLVFSYGHESTVVQSKDGRKLILNDPIYFLEAKSSEPHLRFYHLQKDPLERRNLVSEFPEEVRKLRKAVEIWQEHNDRKVSDHISEESLRALKELGYAGN